MAINTVLVGYGLAGRVFHAPLIGSCPEFELTAVVTGNPERAEAAATDLPGTSVVPDLDAAFAMRPDLVVIASANVAHAPQTLQALSVGAHVVLDKPIGINLAEVITVRDHADRTRNMVIPFQNRRWDTDFLTLRDVIAQGTLGTLHRFESRMERMKFELTGSWRESAHEAGGVLLDFGAHMVDQALELMGPVVRVNGYARSVRARGIADDDACIELEHASGALSVLIASQVAAASGPRSTLLGTRGAVVAPIPDAQEACLRDGRTPADSDWGVASSEAVATVTTADEVIQLPYVRGRWDVFYPAVAAAIERGAPPPVHLDDAIANMVVLDAAATSAARGERISVSAAHDG